jgi:SpoVK/Ycf46/Vps4 family AAA+-type ATPase
MFAGKGDKELDIQIDNNLLRDALHELNSLVGLENVKQEINEQVKLVKYYREIGKDVLNKFTLHCIFTGNPGTGKTTVARIYAKIYRALGVIERGHLVECDREKLVAGFSGQTATKTATAIDQAMGGVLFIDEAYALQIGARDEVGMEAINTLLKRMEDHREDFIVIAAGYTDNMAEFLRSNPGLKSRFERVIEFGDYAPNQLLDIADKILETENMKMNAEAREHLKAYLQAAYDQRDKFFGNAREVRKVMAEAIKNQNLRMASLESSQRTLTMIETVTLDDLKEFDPQALLSAGKTQGSSLGFKSKGKETAG